MYNRRKALSIFLALTFVLAGATFADTEKWIHVRVDGDDDETVTVNLPLSLVNAAAALIPAEVNQEAELALDDLEIGWSDLRTFWQAVKDAPEATFVTVQTRDETVEVKKQGEYLLVRTTEQRTADGAEVDVKFPPAVVDALFSGPDGKLDFEAAIQALADEGDGHLVSVRERDQTVRVWIDHQNEVD